MDVDEGHVLATEESKVTQNKSTIMHRPIK